MLDVVLAPEQGRLYLVCELAIMDLYTVLSREHHIAAILLELHRIKVRCDPKPPRRPA